MDKNKKKQISLGMIASYLTIITQCLTGILYTPIILSSLGQSQYGIYSLCLSFSGYLTIFNAGMNAAFVRFYVQTKTKDISRVPSLNGIFARVFLVLSALSLFVGLIISWKVRLFFGSKISGSEYELLRNLFIVLAFTTCITVINCIFSSLIIANEHFIFGKFVNLFQIILAPIITIPLLLNGFGAMSVFLIKLILLIGIVIVNAWFCFTNLKVKFEFASIDLHLLRSILIFAGAIAIQSISDQLNWQIDKFVLAWTNGTSEISIYSVGSTLNTYYLMISGAVSGVFIAEVNRLVALELDKKVSELFVKTSRIFALLILLIITGYIVLGKQFILKWAGVEYGNSYYIGLLIMLPVSPVLIMGLGQDITRAKNRHLMLIIINTTVSLLNLLISIPLAMRYGAIGSALGTFIAEIVITVVIISIYWRKVVKLDVAGVYLELLKMSRGLIIPLVFGYAIQKFKMIQISWKSIILWGVSYIVIYAFSMWLFAMNQYEKKLFRNAVEKVIEHLKKRET